MQRLDVVHPGEGNLVVAPLAAHQHGDLVVAGALERPVVDRGDAFDHVERIRSRVLRARDLRHAVSENWWLGFGWDARQPHAMHQARSLGADNCDAESPEATAHVATD